MPKLDYAYTDPSSFTSGQTPYGTYDADSTFQTDIVSVTKWVAKRLGFPVLQLEIPSGSIYACFDDLSLRQQNALLNYLGNHFILGSHLEQITFFNIKQKVLNKTYAGSRHLKGLPVRGQRTKTNASTCRKIKFKE